MTLHVLNKKYVGYLKQLTKLRWIFSVLLMYHMTDKGVVLIHGTYKRNLYL